MKKTIITLSLLISLAFAQKNKPVVTIDSVAIQKALELQVSKFIDSTVQVTSLKDFKGFVYDNLSAKKYEEFMQLYNYFLQVKYAMKKP